MASAETAEPDRRGPRAADGQHTSEDSDEDGAYYFESDHLALKGNKEYQELLKTLVILESQKSQAIEDLDKLLLCQEKALKDPIEFVQNLQSGVSMNFPQPIKIAKIPEVDWDSYAVAGEQLYFDFPKHMTRNKRSGLETASVLSDDASSVSASSCSQLDSHLGDLDGPTVVRGRIKEDGKCETFNKLWTVEEQKRLEDLLTKYPPEETEAKRWQKIAADLGNRTPAQVASRVQKYFIKLAKAGLPVPGKIPNLTIHCKKVQMHKHQRHNRFYYGHNASTFMHAIEPPVYMSQSDEEDKASNSAFDIPDDISDDESIPVWLRNTDEYNELMKLKRVQRERLQDGGTSGMTQHVGYKCDKCECEPIIGVRWHCQDCPNELAIDLCPECIDSQFETATHNSSHRMGPVHYPHAQGIIDKDYTKFTADGYNYLDPNFMPTT